MKDTMGDMGSCLNIIMNYNTVKFISTTNQFHSHRTMSAVPRNWVDTEPSGYNSRPQILTNNCTAVIICCKYLNMIFTKDIVNNYEVINCIA